MKRIVEIQRLEVYFFTFVVFYLLGSIAKEHEPYTKDPPPQPTSVPAPASTHATIHPLVTSYQPRPSRPRRPPTSTRRAGASR